jgi:hypothetical protein
MGDPRLLPASAGIFLPVNCWTKVFLNFLKNLGGCAFLFGWGWSVTLLFPRALSKVLQNSWCGYGTVFKVTRLGMVYMAWWGVGGVFGISFAAL